MRPVGFSLRQKKISSTVVMLVEDDTLTIYKTYIQIYHQLLITLAEDISVLPLWLNKPKWDNHTQFPPESSENHTSSGDPRGIRNWSLHLNLLTIRSRTHIRRFLCLVYNMGLTKVFSPCPIYKANIYKNRTKIHYLPNI